MDIDTLRVIFRVIEFFFTVYLLAYILFMILAVTVGAVTLYEQRINKIGMKEIERDYFVPVSIIIPAHNESVTVCDTVKSLLKLDYQIYEIIVVDDGSTDGTAELVQSCFNMQKITRPLRRTIDCGHETGIWVTYEHGRAITLISKVNGGKADALNAGINASEYPYVLCMDADSMLQNDSLRNIAAKVIEEDDVLAVGGMIRIINSVTLKDGFVAEYKLPESLVQCMQVLEYDRSFLASRILFDKFNGNLIISGAFGLFQKAFLLDIGGYSTDTMGEDMELVVRMHAFARANRIPYKIRYAPDAVCWSQAPSTLRDLCRQRRRWHIGLFQSISRHRGMLFDLRYGALSFVSFVYFSVYELFSPYIETFGVISIALAFWLRIVNMQSMTELLLMYMLLSALMGITAFFSRVMSMELHLSKRDILKAVLVSFVENIGLRTLLFWTRFTALIGYNKKKNDWGTIKRHRYNGMDESEDDEK